MGELALGKLRRKLRNSCGIYIMYYEGLQFTLWIKVNGKLPVSRNPDETSTFTNKGEIICIESRSAAQYLKQWIILDTFLDHGSNYLQQQPKMILDLRNNQEYCINTLMSLDNYVWKIICNWIVGNENSTPAQRQTGTTEVLLVKASLNNPDDNTAHSVTDWKILAHGKMDLSETSCERQMRRCIFTNLCPLFLVSES